MGYRVEYETTTKRWRGKGSGRFAGLTAAFLVLFLVLVNTYWSQGRMVLSQLLWPGDLTATKQAVEALVEELRWGEPIGDAVEGFCWEILQDADLVG